MDSKTTGFPADRTEPERRKDLSDEQVGELERAGGAEGGLQAGSAGGPGSDPEPSVKSPGEEPGRRSKR
ncbi:MAG TPA: hypothetical protein VHS33_04895 [Sphingomicrobium sp.]|nr:hypothetical protein [Sphingomicrobium sp.]